MQRSLLLVTAIAVAAAAGIAVSFSHDSDVLAPPRLAASQPAAVAAPQIVAASEPAPVTQLAAVPDSREAIRLSFAPIVKRVAPAVVNVYATSRVQVRSPFEGDPFFERFFGDGILSAGRGSASAPRSAQASSSIRPASSSPTTTSSAKRPR